MATLIHDRVAIDERLRALRSRDREVFDGPDRWVLDAVLDSCHVTVDPGPEDTFHDTAIPLRNMLSLFDDEGRRRRVSEIAIDCRHRAAALERRRSRAKPFSPGPGTA